MNYFEIAINVFWYSLIGLSFKDLVEKWATIKMDAVAFVVLTVLWPISGIFLTFMINTVDSITEELKE